MNTDATILSWGVDTGKVLGASFSGYSSKAGDPLTLKLKKQGSAAVLVGQCKMHYALAYDSILHISDTGVTILD